MFFYTYQGTGHTYNLCHSVWRLLSPSSMLLAMVLCVFTLPFLPYCKFLESRKIHLAFSQNLEQYEEQ